MKLPEITIHIKPVDTNKVAVSAEWVSPDGTPRTLKPQASVPLATLDDFLGDIVYELFDEIKTIEERTNG